jgi:hypothetical protein
MRDGHDHTSRVGRPKNPYFNAAPEGHRSPGSRPAHQPRPDGPDTHRASLPRTDSPSGHLVQAKVRMVLTHPAKTEAIGAVRIYHSEIVP